MSSARTTRRLGLRAGAPPSMPAAAEPAASRRKSLRFGVEVMGAGTDSIAPGPKKEGLPARGGPGMTTGSGGSELHVERELERAWRLLRRYAAEVRRRRVGG